MSDAGDHIGADEGADRGIGTRYVLAAVFEISFIGAPRDDVAGHFTAAIERAVKDYSRRNVSGTRLIHAAVGEAAH